MQSTNKLGGELAGFTTASLGKLAVKQHLAENWSLQCRTRLQIWTSKLKPAGTPIHISLNCVQCLSAEAAQYHCIMTVQSDVVFASARARSYRCFVRYAQTGSCCRHVTPS